MDNLSMRQKQKFPEKRGISPKNHEPAGSGAQASLESPDAQRFLEFSTLYDRNVVALRELFAFAKLDERIARTALAGDQVAVHAVEMHLEII